MKRRGFLAAVAALPLMPFAGKREAVATDGLRMVGSAAPYIEAFPTMLCDAARAADLIGDKYGKLPAAAKESEMINPSVLLLKSGDGPVALIKAYDGHAPLAFDRDYATREELIAATGQPGRYATCRAEGFWRPFGSINGKPAFLWGAEAV